MCEVVLVSGDCLVEALTVCETAEVKGAAPSVLVKVCGEVVVTNWLLLAPGYRAIVQTMRYHTVW